MKRNIRRMLAGLLAASLLCPLLSGCRKPVEHSTTIFAMDTVMNLIVYDDPEALDRAVEDLYHMEKQFSATTEDSLVSRLNRGETVSPSHVLQDLLTQSLLGHVFAFALSLDNMADAVHEDASLSIAMAQLFHNSAKMSRK